MLRSPPIEPLPTPPVTLFGPLFFPVEAAYGAPTPFLGRKGFAEASITLGVLGFLAEELPPARATAVGT